MARVAPVAADVVDPALRYDLIPGATMTMAQFDALIPVLPRLSDVSVEAARRVLVYGERVVTVYRDLGILGPALSRVVSRIRKVHLQMQDAYETYPSYVRVMGKNCRW